MVLTMPSKPAGCPVFCEVIKKELEIKDNNAMLAPAIWDMKGIMLE